MHAGGVRKSLCRTPDGNGLLGACNACWLHRTPLCSTPNLKWAYGLVAVPGGVQEYHAKAFYS